MIQPIAGFSGGIAAELSSGAAGAVPIPLNDLSRQTASLRDEIDRVVSAVLASGRYVMGPNVFSFEAEFAAYCGSRHAISVGNGTDALELAVRAVGAGPGREVVTVANAGMYATAAILAIGATPVFADIDPSCFTMSSESLERCLGPKTSAVVITHLYGRLAELDRLKAIADRHGIPLIEDCAQAVGAERAGRKAGTRGAIGCFSFYPTKNLGALGDGGALTTGNDQLADVLRKLRQYGWDKKYSAERPYGRNSRLDELQAAILRIKLGKLDGWNARRREIVARYRNAASPKVSVPLTDAADHVAHLCVVRCKERSALRAFLAARQIGTDIHYPIPDHCQKAVIGMWAERDKLTITEASMDEILTIPCFPEMTDAEVERVANALAEFGGAQARP